MKSADQIKLALLCCVAFLAARYLLGERESNRGAVTQSTSRAQNTHDAHAYSPPPRLSRATLLPSIERKTRSAALTIKQETLLEHGAQASYTWATIARAEADLRNSSLRDMYLSDPPMVVSDCFTEASEPVEEFSYTLRVTAKKNTITVDDFKADSNNLPRPVSECLDYAFAGEATIEIQTTSDDDGFLEFETTLNRQDFAAVASARVIGASSREEFLEVASRPYQSKPDLTAQKQEFQNDIGLTLQEFREKRLPQ